MATISNTGTQLNTLLTKLGLPEDFSNSQVALLKQTNVNVLKSLNVAYEHCTQAPGETRFTAMMNEASRRLPPFGWNRHPTKVLPVMIQLCGAGCSGHENADALTGSKGNAFKRLFNRRRRTGAKLEMLLRNNPHARAAFEAAVGGKISRFGRRDGRVTIQRFSPASMPMPNPAASGANAIPATNVLGVFAQMENAILAQARNVAAIQQQQRSGSAASTGAFPGMVMGGLSSIIAPGNGGMTLGMTGGALGGMGTGSWNPLAMPGRMQNTNPLYERTHQSQVDGVLHDSSLTVEDKVTLMLMLIMNKQDDDIQRQAQYLNSIQQQQSNRRGIAPSGKGIPLSKVGSMSGGAGGPGMAAGVGGLGSNTGGGTPSTVAGIPVGQFGLGEGANSPSIDVETMKLKRMIDKRTQMFDMLRSIIDKYNETAKNIIQAIGR